MKYSIGIIGNGFVGSSVAFGFSPQTGCDATVKIYDKDKSKATCSLSDVLNTSDYIFVSVPTPSNGDGSINLDIIYEIFANFFFFNNFILKKNKKIFLKIFKYKINIF